MPRLPACARWRQRNAGAQFNIGLMYANGKGVVKDQTRAHMWLSLAISSGVLDAIEKRDHIALNMTDDEIDKSRRMAHEWCARRA